MKEFAHCCLRRPMAFVCRLLVCAFAIVTMGYTPVNAGPSAMLVRVVQNDRGGVVGVRAQEIADIQVNQQRVEIRGKVCLSTWNVCVDPSTRFGFHGPSYYGRPLQPRQFEYWSQVIASYYPDRLRNWYLNTGRYKAEGYYTITGAQLIRMGISQC